MFFTSPGTHFARAILALLLAGCSDRILGDPTIGFGSNAGDAGCANNCQQAEPNCFGDDMTPTLPASEVLNIGLASASTVLPSSLAQLQARLPGAQISSADIFRFDGASGDIPNLAGAIKFNVSSGVHRAEYTPFSGVLAMSVETNDVITAQSAALFSRNHNAFTFVAVVRADVGAAAQTTRMLFDKIDPVDNRGMSFTLGTQLTATFNDGVKANTVSTSANNNYADGAWHLFAVTWAPSTGEASIVTESEVANATLPNLGNFDNTIAATLLNSPDVTDIAYGSLAYVAFFPQTLDAASIRALWRYGEAPTGLTFVQTTGALTYGVSDATGQRVNKTAVTQYPVDQRFGTPAYYAHHGGDNYLLESENLAHAPWVPDANVTVTPYAAAAPDGSFTAARITTARPTQTLWLSQPASVYFSQQASAAVWLRADAPQTAALRLTVQNPDGTVSTEQTSAQLTTQWRRYVIDLPVANVSLVRAATFSIAPVANADPAAGSVYAWAANLSTEIGGGDYASTDDIVQSASAGRLSFAMPALPSSGWIELTFTPYALVPDITNLFSITPSATGSAVELLAAPPYLSSRLQDPTGALSDYYPWDLRKMWIVGKRVQLIFTWRADTKELLYYANGLSPPPSATVSIPAQLAAGTATVATDNVHDAPPISLESVRVGAGFVEPAEAIARAATAGVLAPLRVAAIGDSITGFYNGYHVELMLQLGTDKAFVNNVGVSGDTTANVLARLERDIVGRGYRDAIVLIGINDVIFAGLPSSEIIENLQTIYADLNCLGIRVFAVKLLPCKGNTWAWDPAIAQGVADVNAWLDTKPMFVERVIETSALGSLIDPDVFDPAWTTDGLHPNALGSQILGDLIAQQAYGISQ